MDQKRNTDLLHSLENTPDFPEVGDTGRGIRGGVGGIKLHAGEYPVPESLLDIVGVGVIGQVAGHQRLEGAVFRQRFHDALAISPCIRGCRDRRHQIGHHDRPPEFFRGMGNGRLQHVAIADMQVPIVRLADRDAVDHETPRQCVMAGRNSPHNTHLEE
jgi:hypothetical protein